MPTSKYFLSAAIAVIAVATTSSAFAQQASDAVQAEPDTGIEDIVVTAQRREERLQDVPISVAAVTSAKLAQNGVRDAKDLSVVVPGLNISTPAGQMQPRLRGVGASISGPGMEQPVAVYVDGVYIASSASSLLTLNNIERVEVLKGPQGTLFGRNATGGLVQIITKDPTSKPTANFGVGYGNYDTVIADAYVSSGLTDTISGDVAVHYEHQGDGWGKNLLTGHDVHDLDHDFAVRSKWLFEPTDNTQVRLTADYSSRRSTREAFTLSPQNAGIFGPAGIGAFDTPVFGGPYPTGGYYDVNQNIENTTKLRQGGIALSIKQDLGGDIVLQSITAYRKSRFFLSIDADITPSDLTLIEDTAKQRQFSQELQISHSGDNLKWVAGVYYFSANDRWAPFLAQFGPSLISPVAGVPVTIDLRDRTLTESYAAYAQATYEILPRTNLTLGGRFTHESKRVSGSSDFIVAGTVVGTTPVPTPGLGFPNRLSGDNFSYRIALDHKLTDAILLYASYNTGYKSGGFNLADPSNPPFAPEKIKAMELGFKSDLFDRKLRLNVSAYRYNYRNIQVSRYIGGTSQVYNGAGARMWGGDIELQAVLGHGVSVNGGLAYDNTHFTSFPNADFIIPVGGCTPPVGGFCSASANGKRLPFAPEVTFNVGVDYKVEVAGGTLNVNATYYRSGKFYAAPDNVGAQRAYDLINASVEWTDPSDMLSVRLWGRNLGNTHYAAALIENPTIAYAPGAPRTYGVTLGVKY